jgi:hypothetical protein
MMFVGMPGGVAGPQSLSDSAQSRVRLQHGGISMSFGTTAKTKVQIGNEQYRETNIRFNCSMKRRFFEQHLLHYLRIRRADLSDTGNLTNNVAVYAQRLRAMQDERLGLGKEVFSAYITTPEVDEEIKARSTELFSDEIVREAMSGGANPRAMATALVHDLLTKRPEIKSVANIGAFVDTQCAYLAPRHLNVSFLSVDRYGDLAAVNGYLPQSPNWTFAAGYALDMLTDGKLHADVIFMTSTSVNFTAREFARYIELFSRSCRFLVFNEPWWPALKSLKFWEVPRPESVNPLRPLIGLNYFNYQHNYIYHLERNGFDISSSRIVQTYVAPGFVSPGAWYTLQIVAEKRALFH